MAALIKFFTPVLHPVGFGWLLLCLGAAWSWKRGRRRQAWVGGGVALGFWLLVQPPLTGSWLGGLERPWTGSTLADAPEADAVLVLGGGWRPSLRDYRGLDLTEASDRLITGLDLCRRGRARVLVLGGDAPVSEPGLVPDSERVRGWVADWGLSGTEVVTLGGVVNTRQEAERCRELVERRGWKRILLVTSAFHMSRAEAAFRKAGVPVHPVACDFRWIRTGDRPGGWRVFPDEEGLLNLTVWWHELLGSVAYRWLGAG